MPTAPARAPFTPYQRKLFVFLGVATFFEGFDHVALAQLLPALTTEMNLDDADNGNLVAVVNVGTILAFALVRLADRAGRRPVLNATIAGYTIASFLSGLAPSLIPFALLQLVARIFLIGEWGISQIYAAEEFPAARRGEVLGLIGALASLGSVICAVVVPMLLRHAPYGWRSVYFVGTLPLLLLAFARRGIRETARFEELTPEARKPAPLGRILGTGYRKRVLQLAAIWFCIYACSQTGVTFWKKHAVEELGLAEQTVGNLIAIAAVVAMPLVFGAGRLLDVVGRRAGAAIIFTALAIGTVGAYQLESTPLLVASLVLIVFGASAVLPALNAFTTELFPTHLRSDALAWSNNLLGRIAFVLSPLIVSRIAVGSSWSVAVALTAIGPIIAIALVLAWMPETRGKELEETSAL